VSEEGKSPMEGSETGMKYIHRKTWRARIFNVDWFPKLLSKIMNFKHGLNDFFVKYLLFLRAFRHAGFEAKGLNCLRHQPLGLFSTFEGW